MNTNENRKLTESPKLYKSELTQSDGKTNEIKQYDESRFIQQQQQQQEYHLIHPILPSPLPILKEDSFISPHGPRDLLSTNLPNSQVTDTTVTIPPSSLNTTSPLEKYVVGGGIGVGEIGGIAAAGGGGGEEGEVEGERKGEGEREGGEEMNDNKIDSHDSVQSDTSPSMKKKTKKSGDGIFNRVSRLFSQGSANQNNQNNKSRSIQSDHSNSSTSISSMNSNSDPSITIRSPVQEPDSYISPTDTSPLTKQQQKKKE
jgi:hypothetical protein